MPLQPSRHGELITTGADHSQAFYSSTSQLPRDSEKRALQQRETMSSPRWGGRTESESGYSASASGTGSASTGEMLLLRQQVDQLQAQLGAIRETDSGATLPPVYEPRRDLGGEQV